MSSGGTVSSCVRVLRAPSSACSFLPPPAHEPHIALYPPFADLLVDGGVANHAEHVGDTSYH